MRALAVLAVVAFHARMPGFSAGFVGVDVFLVLSGYLIGGLILRECDADQFGLIRFYERRIRRILPALLAMLVVTALIGWMMLPSDFKHFGASLAAISVFLSNVLFARASGYFGENVNAMPLLHTWSLAVEEQFYLAFPVMLLLARRTGPIGMRILLLGAAVVSFAYSVRETGVAPLTAFYSPASRAWEFLAGAVLAAGGARSSPGRAVGDAAALFGLGLLGASLFWLRAGQAFPGTSALPVVAGSLLILWGTTAEGSRVARMLSIRPLVAIGLISYSLYLWHWPMIVFGTYYVVDPHAQAAMRGAMALLAFPVAWLSWRFVERPFREPHALLSRRTLVLGVIAGSGALALGGVAIYRADGFPDRFDRAVRRLTERGAQPDYGCANRSVDVMLHDTACLIGGAGPHPQFVLWGDSHAAVYFPALDALARRHGVAGYDAAKLGCPPLMLLRAPDSSTEKATVRAEKTRQCAAHNRDVLRFLLEERPRVVLLAAVWSSYALGKHALRDYDDLGFERSVERLHAAGIRVYLVQDVPDAPRAEPRMLAKAYLTGAAAAVEPDLATYLRRDTGFRAMTSALRRRGRIAVIEPALRLCDTKTCRVTEGGYPLYYDTNHLSARGAFLITPLFEPMMRFIAEEPPHAGN